MGEAIGELGNRQDRRAGPTQSPGQDPEQANGDHNAVPANDVNDSVHVDLLGLKALPPGRRKSPPTRQPDNESAAAAPATSSVLAAPTVTLDPGQAATADGVAEWYSSSGDRIRRIIGPAGSGKTTLIKPIAERLGLPLRQDRATAGGIRVATYTNRAALVLRAKGIDARTIHAFAGWGRFEVPPDAPTQACYAALLQAVADAAGMRAQRAAERALNEFLDRFRIEHGEKYGLDPDNIFNRTDLVIFDEVSMIDPEMGALLEKSCSRLLIFGDPDQLGPPSSNDSYFFPPGFVPDHALTTIHRQGDGNLRDFLQLLRDAGDAAVLREIGSRFEPEVTIVRGHRFPARALAESDIVIARGHQEVFHLNQQVRQAKDYSRRRGPLPGEPIIALRQNVPARLHKHDICTLTEELEYDAASRLVRAPVVRIHDRKPIGVRLLDGTAKPPLFLPEFFTDAPGRRDQSEWKRLEDKAKFEATPDGVARWSGTLKFSFAHAISAYACQGSEWDTVLVSYADFKRRGNETEESSPPRRLPRCLHDVLARPPASDCQD